MGEKNFDKHTQKKHYIEKRDYLSYVHRILIWMNILSTVYTNRGDEKGKWFEKQNIMG